MRIWENPDMGLIWLRIRAPFAAYRPMQAGSLRATLPVMTYSALWGLALNLAGIETRQDHGRVATGIDPAAPALRLAIGLPGVPAGVSSLFQQVHSYPVGNASAHLEAGTHGAKYHIAPARRELLVDLDVVTGIDGEQAVLDRVLMGLAGSGNWSRYGLPFAGDNNLLFDRIDPLPSPPPCRWYTTVDPRGRPQPGATRLSTNIDRADSSRTQSAQVAPTPNALHEPPGDAWHLIGPAVAERAR